MRTCETFTQRLEVDRMTTSLNLLDNKGVSDEKAIQEFIQDCRLRNFSDESIRSYRSILKITANYLNHNSLTLLKLDRYSLKELLRHLTEERGYSPKTLENYFSALSSFCDYLAYEGLTDRNPILPFRKRYLRQYKSDGHNRRSNRQLISIEQMRVLINSILDPRDRAIVTVLAKTGIRRKELIKIDISNINWEEQSIELKAHPKRSNLTVFFDDECTLVLRRWIRARENYEASQDCKALFIGERGERLERHGVYSIVTKYATRVSLNDPKSKRIEDHFTPHCCRHWFTTHLRRNGLRREFLKELRGDARKEAVDIYDHIDKKELRRAYLAAVPLLGID
jgi:integrase/recombinase XerD